MKQIRFDGLVFLSILIICSSQRLLYHCDFDSGLSDVCRFTSEPGAPILDASYGIMSVNLPTQPLSDVKSIVLPTTPNNEFCTLPHTYISETWPTYFCRQNSLTNYTCQTQSGLGNCMAGQYGLVKLSRNVEVNFRYTSVETVKNYVNTSQCIDFYYYITDTSYNAHIYFGWSTGLAPNLITDVRAQSENKWQNFRYTYLTPSEPDYHLLFVMLRDRGNANFSFALDEIKIVDGPCETLTTINPDITISNTQTTSSIIVNPSSSISEIPTTESDISTTTSLGRTDSPTMGRTLESNDTDLNTLISFSSSTTTTTNNALTSSDEINTKENTISSTIVITTTRSTSQSTRTSTTTTTLPTSSNGVPDLPLILGLALGLPVVILIISGSVYYFKIVKPKRKILVRSSNNDEIPLT